MAREVKQGTTTKATNRWLFNRKEIQTTGNLNLLDYGARMLSTEWGRWGNMDPMVEKYYSLTPYDFVGGNPISRVDPNGRDWYQSTSGAVVWRDDNAGQVTISDEVYKNIGASHSSQNMGGDGYVNYYQNQVVSISSAAVDARQTVLNNPALAGRLLSTSSPLSERSQQGLMADVIHQGQSDFINHPVTQATFDAMFFVATGGIEGGFSLGKGLVQGLGRLLARETTSQPIWALGGFKSTARWTNQMAKRGWNNQQISQAIAQGKQYPAVNHINPGNPAIRYVHPQTSQSVVMDQVTKEILHIGGKGFSY